MAELKFTIPDARMKDLVDAWGTSWQETDITTGEPNPQTKAQFAKEEIRRMIVQRTQQYLTLQQPEFPIT